MRTPLFRCTTRSAAALAMTLGWALTCVGCTDGTGAASGADGSASPRADSNAVAGDDVAGDRPEESPVDAGADLDAPALDANGAILCTQLCGQGVPGDCAQGTICVTAHSFLFSGGGTCVPVPTACVGNPTCDCLGSSLCDGGSSYACYSASELASPSPSCLSGVACTNASCRHPAGGALCGDAQCGSGSVCVSQFGGGINSDAAFDPVCQPVPAACANNVTCDCLGATLCVGNGEYPICTDDDAGCSQSVVCGAG